MRQTPKQIIKDFFSLKKKIILFLFATLILPVSNQIHAKETKLDFPIGEHLVYKVTWLKIPVGTGEIWAREKITLNGREVFHVVGKIDTNQVLSKIFPMHDLIDSWIDAETLTSVQFEKKIDELLIDAHEKMIFDVVLKKGHFESFTTGQKNEFPITTPAHDVLSAFYWARRQSLEPGTSAQSVICADQKNWALTINVIRKETITQDDHKIETIRIEPNTIVNGEEKRGRAWINLTDDRERKPVRIVFKAPFGSIVGTLKKSKN